MWRRRCLTLAALVALFLACLGPSAAAQPTARVWLPLIIGVPSPVEVVVTANGVHCMDCYPSYSYVLGHLRTLPDAPASSVTLSVELTIWPYDSGTEATRSSFTQVVTFTPALTVTLPGQLNPFEYVVVNGKGFTSVSSDVRVASVTYQPPETPAVALTIVQSSRLGTQLTGEARNDSSRSLSSLRVVAVGPHLCGWRLATLEATQLAPGATTPFSLDYYCSSDPVAIIGQGVADP